MHLGGELQWADSWNVITAPTGAVVVHAGPDRSFEIGGLDHTTVSQLERWAAGAAIEPQTPAEDRLADRLLDVGAINPPRPTRVGLAGDHDTTSSLAEALKPHGIEVVDTDPDLVISVRGEGGWPTVDTAHLAVDARYHHTLVIGPYVIPGRSTCTACLDGRIERRWPRFDDPPVPAASTRRALLAELLAIHIDLIQRQASPLVNGTISWDLEHGRTEHTTVLKVPGCTVCERSRPDGRLELPIS